MKQTNGTTEQNAKAKETVKKKAAWKEKENAVKYTNGLYNRFTPERTSAAVHSNPALQYKSLRCFSCFLFCIAL